MQHIPNHFLRPLFVLFTLMPYLGGCNEPEVPPAYLYIDTVRINAAPLQGTSSHAVKTVWLSLNGQSLGAYELPTTVPILAEGTQQILVEAGIANSGVLSNRVKYPFYAPRSYDINLVPLQTAMLSPELSYEPDVVFEFINNFEVGSDFVVLLGNEAQLDLTDNVSLVFEGNRSLYAHTDVANPVFTIATIDAYALPVANAPVYIEMNYRCDAPFYVTLRGIAISGAQTADLRLQVNPKTSWNKIYVDVEPMISALTSNYDFFQVVIGAQLPDSLNQATYLFDNLKLVHQ